MRKSLPLFVAAFTLAGAGMASAANDQRHAVTPEQAAAAPLAAAAADVSGTHTRQGVVYQADGAFLTLMDGTAFLIGDPRMTEVARGEVVPHRGAGRPSPEIRHGTATAATRHAVRPCAR